MYIPENFELKDLNRIKEMIRKYPFANLITCKNEFPKASPIPFLLDPEKDFELIFHLAEKNGQNQDLPGGRSLAIFQGPHGFISASNYSNKTAPTWNHLSIHVYGECEEILNPDRKWEWMKKTTHAFEDKETDIMDKIPEKKLATMMKEIRVYRLLPSRILGQEKMSQDRPSKEVKRIIKDLEKDKDHRSRELADFMKNRE